jgi:peptidoglycan L-alanyl-D-glutamate endopeptidase CwlK
MNERSRRCLLGVHPDLVRVSGRAFEIEPHIITCGLRTLEQQKALKAAGKSKTLNSRHLTGHAIDFAEADGHYDLPDMKRIGAAYKAAAAELGIPIEWGGDWKGAWDTPHVQLAWKAYPAGNGGLSLAQKTVEAVKTKPVLVPAAATGGGIAAPLLPALPAPPDLTALTQWQAAGETASNFLTWAAGRPVVVAALIVWVGGLALWNKLPDIQGLRSSPENSP